MTVGLGDKAESVTITTAPVGRLDTICSRHLLNPVYNHEVAPKWKEKMAGYLQCQVNISFTDDLRTGRKQCLQGLSAANAGERAGAPLYGCTTSKGPLTWMAWVKKHAGLKISKTNIWNLKYFKVWNYLVSTKKYLDFGFRLVFRDQSILKISHFQQQK